MTCIVAIKDGNKIWMGADDTITLDEKYYISGGDKLVKTENMLMGFAGDLYNIQFVRFGFKPKLQTLSQTDLEYLTTVFAQEIKKRLREFEVAEEKSDEENGKKIDEKSSQIVILLAYRGNLYCIEEDFSVFQLKRNFHAIGAGHAVAIGSLFTTDKGSTHTEERIRVALEAASSYVMSVGTGIKIETIEF